MPSTSSISTTPPQYSPVISAASSRPSTPNLSTPPTSAASDKGDDSGRLRMILSLLRKFISVADLASVRFSLPASLLEPIPNLEYWQYLDRPETFTSIGSSDDKTGRMLEVLRFWFTKDLKYVKGRPCKPYNSVLGEFFRCNWDIQREAPPIPLRASTDASAQPATDPLEPVDGHEAVRISYVTEQTSHHPPLSAYFIDCPARGLTARGYDQISAKFTGTAVKVVPSGYNRGIFINLAKRNNEEYQLTHVTASLGGLLRGSLAISVADTAYITCPDTRLKAILTYLEEGWVGKSQNRMTGVVYRYDPDDDKYSKIKDVPEKEIVARVEGCWQEQIYYSLTQAEPGKNGSQKNGSLIDKQLLVDLVPLMPVPKIVPPPEEQLSNESRRFWQDLTTAMLAKKTADANQVKQDIEQKQRDKAEQRKKDGVEWEPRFFTKVAEDDGKPELTQEGKRLLEGMQKLHFNLKETETAA